MTDTSKMTTFNFVHGERASGEAEAVDILLFCPNCAEQHIDEAKPDICETCGHGESECTCGVYTAWLNPPHKSHRCNYCNHVWRPADVPTNGVLKTKTQGSRDADPIPATNQALASRNLRARIAELTAQLAEAQKYNTFNGQYEEYITGEAFNAMEGYIQEKARAEAAEARLKEAEGKYQIAFDNAQVLAGRLTEAGEQSEKAEADAGRLRGVVEWVLKEVQERIAVERGLKTASIEDYFRIYKRISVGFYDKDVAMLQAALSAREGEE